MVGCLLNWVDYGIVKLAGTSFASVYVLLFVSLLSSGYAFYNSFNDTNRNPWVYLFSGIIGIGSCLYALSIGNQSLSFLSQFSDNLTDIFMDAIGVGFYVTAVNSIILFFLGFDKGDSIKEIREVEFIQTQSVNNSHDVKLSAPVTTSELKTENEKPMLQEWLKSNPGRSINDYYSKYKS